MASDVSITKPELSEDDLRLVERAEEATRIAFNPDRWGGAHMVGSALLTADGRIFTGVSMPANVGRTSMCAEPIALGSAIGDGVRDFETIVAVRHPLPDENRDFEIVPPCGACRELIADYGHEIEIIVPHDEELRKVKAIDLLPTRNW
jgi:cytidine deaminase